MQQYEDDEGYGEEHEMEGYGEEEDMGEEMEQHM
jgi:hypothetical protein